MKYDSTHPAPQGGTAERVWKSGPPPHIGWWNASCSKAPVWRWWDGHVWSDYRVEEDRSTRGTRAATPEQQECIRWSDYYPEGARVPRVDPSDPKNFAIVSLINTGTPTALQAVERRMCNRRIFDRLPDGSTRTVREMKERMRCPEAPRFIPLPKPTKEEWVEWAKGVQPPPPPPGYVSGSRQRLSESVRINDVDFSGAMGRNTTSRTGRNKRLLDTEVNGWKHVRSNGQAQNPERREIGDPFHGVNTMALMRELFRRFNAAP